MTSHLQQPRVDQRLDKLGADPLLVRGRVRTAGVVDGVEDKHRHVADLLAVEIGRSTRGKKCVRWMEGWM
jgi:hypothetical protein